MADDKSIWQYRKFSQFVQILQKGLWFSRLDYLRDPFEGRSERSYKSRFREGIEAQTRMYCVNCWTIDDDESELMWYAYADDLGVAIRSTKHALKASFSPPHADKIVIGRVEYGGSNAPSDRPHMPAFKKRRAFKWEQELRAMIPYEYEFKGGKRIKPTYEGKLVPVTLSSLIVEVWVAPNSKGWFKDVVELELGKYGHSGIPVKKRA